MFNIPCFSSIILTYQKMIDICKSHGNPCQQICDVWYSHLSLLSVVANRCVALTEVADSFVALTEVVDSFVH